MSGFDLSDAFDPDYVDSFTVRRQAESIVNGRSVIHPTDIAPVYGTICAASPNDLARVPDSSSFTRAISVITPFHCKGVEIGFQPDLILWKGSQYLVKHVDLYPHMGPGFFQVIASSVTSQEPAV